MDSEDLKVRFVKDLNLAAKAMCLYWIDEIHIDESLKDSPAVNDIVKHEQKHYRIVQRILATNSHILRWLLMFYNNLWDIFSCIKIQIKYFKKQLASQVGAILIVCVVLVILRELRLF